jgi:hypothetical protein
MTSISDQFFRNNKSMTTKYVIPFNLGSPWARRVADSYAVPPTNTSCCGGTINYNASYNPRANSYSQPTKQGSGFDSFTGGYRGTGGLGNP